MADPMSDLLVCGYPDVETAEQDFDDVISRVKAKEVGIQGVILIARCGRERRGPANW